MLRITLNFASFLSVHLEFTSLLIPYRNASEINAPQYVSPTWHLDNNFHCVSHDGMKVCPLKFFAHK